MGADVGAGRDVGIAEGSIGTAVGMIVGVVVGCSGDSGLIGDTAVGASRTQAPAPTTSNKPKTTSVFFILHTPEWADLFCLPGNNNCTLKLPRHRLQQIQRLNGATNSNLALSQTPNTYRSISDDVVLLYTKRTLHTIEGKDIFMNTNEEKALISRVQEDPQAFSRLYDHYFPRLYAYVSYRVGRVQDAEDLVAETFLKAIERIESLALPRFAG